MSTHPYITHQEYLRTVHPSTRTQLPFTQDLEAAKTALHILNKTLAALASFFETTSWLPIPELQTVRPETYAFGLEVNFG